MNDGWAGRFMVMCLAALFLIMILGIVTDLACGLVEALSCDHCRTTDHFIYYTSWRCLFNTRVFKIVDLTIIAILGTVFTLIELSQGGTSSSQGSKVCEFITEVIPLWLLNTITAALAVGLGLLFFYWLSG